MKKKTQVSSKFKRALESELRRLMEALPRVGQKVRRDDGQAGIIIKVTELSEDEKHRWYDGSDYIVDIKTAFVDYRRGDSPRQKTITVDRQVTQKELKRGKPWRLA